MACVEIKKERRRRRRSSGGGGGIISSGNLGCDAVNTRSRGEDLLLAKQS